MRAHGRTRAKSQLSEICTRVVAVRDLKVPKMEVWERVGLSLVSKHNQSKAFRDAEMWPV